MFSGMSGKILTVRNHRSDNCVKRLFDNERYSYM